MRNTGIIACLLGAAAGAIAGAQEPKGPKALKDARAQIQSAKVVDEGGMGISGKIGPFDRLQPVFLKHGNAEYFKAMLKDKHVMVRIMGMRCLAKTQRRKCAPLLRERLTGRTFITTMRGCIVDHTTEGGYARCLLRRLAKSPADEVALDLEILARDACGWAHRHAREALAKDLAAKRLPLDLARLRAKFPKISSMDLVKAIGRIPPKPEIKTFCLSCLRDAKLPREVRLAAASALTRYGDDDALKAIRSAEKALNGDAKPPPAEGIIKHFEERRVYQRLRETLTDYKKRPADPKEHKALLLRFLRCDHPMIVFDMRQTKGLYGLEPEPVKAHAMAFVGACKRFAEVDQPWNTDADAPYVMDTFVQLGKAAYKGEPEGMPKETVMLVEAFDAYWKTKHPEKK